MAGNFDLLNAPNAGGLFVGDYQGLAGVTSTFVALYVRVNNGDTTNRTDTFADRVDSNVALAATMAMPRNALKEQVPAWTAPAQARVGEHLAAVSELRRRQWQRWLESAPPRM
jgi:hypothetical protein